MSDETKAPQEPRPDEDGSAAGERQSPYKGFFGKVDNFFTITKSGSDYKKEVIAGLTTFMAMGNNPMVGATVAVAVAVQEAMTK